MSLADQVVKGLRPILSGENLVIHGLKSRSFLKNVILGEAKNGRFLFPGEYSEMSRFAQHDRGVKNKQRSPASFPAGPFVKLPELSGHRHAASAGTAGAATAAACVTGRDRRRARQRRNCCNQE